MFNECILCRLPVTWPGGRSCSSARPQLLSLARWHIDHIHSCAMMYTAYAGRPVHVMSWGFNRGQKCMTTCRFLFYCRRRTSRAVVSSFACSCVQKYLSGRSGIKYPLLIFPCQTVKAGDCSGPAAAHIIWWVLWYVRQCSQCVEHQRETGTGHQGWSNLSIFCKLCIFKPWTSFKGVWDWIPGQVQSPVSYSVSSLCVCVCIPVCLSFRTIWWGRRDVTADRIKVKAYSGSAARKTMSVYVCVNRNCWIWDSMYKK